MSPLTPTPTVSLLARQIWAIASDVPTPSTTDCYAYRLHAGGSIVVNNSTIPLINDALLLPSCGPDDDPNAPRQILENAILDVRDPYFASTSPVVFVLAICLTIAWVLLIMLMITPRTFFHGGPGFGVGQMRTGTSGGTIPIVGIGSRPWFQKVATLTVAVSLLLATVRTFDVASDQYAAGFQDSLALTNSTMESLEIRIVRFISTVFEWLAQAQTSLRLFQRHREKVVIKWVALSLLGLEMVFGILNNFTDIGADDGEDFTRVRPRRYANAIPALQYLFEMALSLMYAAVVLYYSMTKRRFAYYHPKMRNVSLVAFLSVIAVLVPVVFFVLDITVQNVYSWGDYVRWVGAAAASVIVWEWVERIEALERDERKDGILGREIFEGDEMLDNGPGPDGSMAGGKKRKTGKPYSSDTTVVASSRDSGSDSSGVLKRRLSDRRVKFPRLDKSVLAKIAALRHAKGLHSKGKRSKGEEKDVELQPAPRVVHRRRRNQNADPNSETAGTEQATQPPQTSASPISRSDCTSASTVYRVVHHPISPTSTPGISETLYPQGNAMNIASPSPDNTKGKKRSSDLVAKKNVNMANLIPFRKRGDANTPETLQTVPDDDDRGHEREEEEEEGEEDGEYGEAARSARDDRSSTSKIGKPGFFSRFRRDASQEQELPPLVIPWRGDEGEANPDDFDLEAGMGAGHGAQPGSSRHNSSASGEPFEDHHSGMRTPARAAAAASSASDQHYRFATGSGRWNTQTGDRRPP